MDVWRYLDLAKLVSLLDTKSLFFARMDIFLDPFEGATPKGVINTLTERSLDSGIPSSLYIAQHEGMSEDFRKYTFVSCWHQSEFESEAMWQLYSDKHKGIAIVTSREKLSNVLPENIEIDSVKYVDFNADKVELTALHFYKRSAFEYEKELRAVVIDRNNSNSGIIVNAEPNEYIEKIIVSPMAQPWFVDVVKSICTKYGCTFEVEESSLSITPSYSFEEYSYINDS
ncbi:MAG: hypothetical protein COA95_09820 [Methylophaga sp.]|nr:MAG: hypothetical protein COA95_09820 [Methylophaga sp.]